ncbi:redoxin domain-containing protein, partial [Microbacterium sp. zg.Y909]|uniref:redoxin domain-containing protein n=1 Tax=Microbacterium sp. zg.Y909 TaxID=2969413 RepID=UPI00214C900C
DNCTNGATELESCGTAPGIRGIEAWLNTPEGAGIDLADLRGQVVLIDFWAYSCINCQRSIPHVVAWDDAYRDAGLQVIGIHSPEYAFEKDAANVAAGTADFGIEYPVALDNSLSTWTNYRNRFWPAHYLIDAEGTVRHISFGEGNYAATEAMIRELLQDADADATLPQATDVADLTPEAGATTPETFLGSGKDVNYGGEERYRAGVRSFAYPDDQPEDSFALEGEWDVQTQFVTPTGDEGGIRLRFTGGEVRMVLAGEGQVQVQVDGEPASTLDVGGTPRSYPLVEAGEPRDGVIEISVPAGVQAYSFTFG